MAFGHFLIWPTAKHIQFYDSTPKNALGSHKLACKCKTGRLTRESWDDSRASHMNFSASKATTELKITPSTPNSFLSIIDIMTQPQKTHWGALNLRCIAKQADLRAGLAIQKKAKPFNFYGHPAATCQKSAKSINFRGNFWP